MISMFLKRTAQLLTVISILIIVDGAPKSEPSSELTDADNQLSNQGKQELFRRIIEILSRPSDQTLKDESEEMHSQNMIVIDQDKTELKRPKHRNKRYVCWHSCLGQWQQKNPRLKDFRRRINNINPGSAGESSASIVSSDIPVPVENSLGDVPEEGSNVDITKPSEGEILDGEATEASTDADATEGASPDAEATEAASPDLEATEAASPDSEATEAASPDAEATEAASSDAEAVSPDAEPTSDPEATEDIEVTADTEASDGETAAEAASEDLPVPEDGEDGKEEKNEEKRHIGSNEEGSDESDETSAEGNGLDDDLPDDYIDQAVS